MTIKSKNAKITLSLRTRPHQAAAWFAIITCKHTTINEKWWKDRGIAPQALPSVATPLKRTGSQ